MTHDEFDITVIGDYGKSNTTYNYKLNEVLTKIKKDLKKDDVYTITIEKQEVDWI